MNETFSVLSIFYGIVAFLVTALWLRKERMDTMGVLTAATVGLMWPMFLFVRLSSLILVRIVSRM